MVRTAMAGVIIRAVGVLLARPDAEAHSAAEERLLAGLRHLLACDATLFV